ncbi:MAG: TetR/AcrR family transcriptional regulator [Nocardioides sp.]|nr:TetR/AcrR family transcriptional regulator [Nocardioides sp.]
MPKAVDVADRRREIAHAALRLIATKGYGAMTLRAVAAELNGSLTLVTHYYANRAALLEGMASQLMGEYDDDLERMERGVNDPWQRLGQFLQWMIPLDEDAVVEERARIILAAETRGRNPEIQQILDTWDREMRRAMRQRVAAVVDDPDDVAALTDMLRVFTNGVVLSVVEHPDEWPPDRQLAALDRFLTDLGLPQAVIASG